SDVVASSWDGVEMGRGRSAELDIVIDMSSSCTPGDCGMCVCVLVIAFASSMSVESASTPTCLSLNAAFLLRWRKNMKMIVRAIIAMGMEMPMPAFAPAVNFFVVGFEVGCVIEFEVDVTIGELLVEMLADCS